MNDRLRHLLRFYTRTFALWVVLCGVLAYFLPAPFIAFNPYWKWLFALTMLGIGVVLEPRDFQRILAAPSVVLIGVCAQFTIMPLGAFVLVRVFNLPDMIAVGLILTGSAPGAMASNVMSYVARADTAYSVSLTAVSTLLCPLLTPGLTWLLASAHMEVPFKQMVFDVIIMVVLPLAGGFALRLFYKEKIEPILDIFPAISVTFIVLICSLVIALNRDYLPQLTAGVFLAVVVLNVYGLASGYGVGRLFRMEVKRRRTLSIEIGMQNAGLGVGLALAHFGDRAAMPAAIFVFICIIIPSLLSAHWQKTSPDMAQLSEGEQ